jgi:hypothetical protein
LSLLSGLPAGLICVRCEGEGRFPTAFPPTPQRPSPELFARARTAKDSPFSTHSLTCACPLRCAGQPDSCEGWVGTTRPDCQVSLIFYSCPPRTPTFKAVGCWLIREMAPSRQERRKAERQAAKRAPAQAGAAGATGAATALANLNVNPLGDWTTHAQDPLVGPARSC